jgi:hypothetical protein
MVQRAEIYFRELGAPKTQPARKQVLDGLAAALKEKPAPPNSTEALLVQWSRIPRDTSIETYRAFEEFYNRARELTLRGADVVPELITLLSDSRITTFHYPGVMNASARSLLLGELAELLLREITGTRVIAINHFRTEQMEAVLAGRSIKLRRAVQRRSVSSCGVRAKKSQNQSALSRSQSRSIGLKSGE